MNSVDVAIVSLWAAIVLVLLYEGLRVFRSPSFKAEVKMLRLRRRLEMRDLHVVPEQDIQLPPGWSCNVEFKFMGETGELLGAEAFVYDETGRFQQRVPCRIEKGEQQWKPKSAILSRWLAKKRKAA